MKGIRRRIMKKCNLDAPVNKCEFFGRNLICNNSNKCSFQEVDPEDVEEIIVKKNGVKKNGYIRKERWYEKYYKDSRPKKS